MTPDGPAADANVARNAHRHAGRRARWAPVREALWALLEPRIAPGSRVAIVGAGNGDDLPLARIAAVADGVVLVDVDPRAATRARGDVRLGLRRRVRVLEHDLTLGAADRAVRQATRPGATGPGTPRRGRAAPLPGGRFDVVVADLVYSQLLYPALLDAGVPADLRRAAIAAHGPALTRGAVARLHASAPLVVHLHDPACWGNGYDQPETLEAVLDAAGRDADAALELLARTKGPRDADPRPALTELGVPVQETRVWRWPFVEGVDYAVVATVAG